MSFMKKILMRRMINKIKYKENLFKKIKSLDYMEMFHKMKENQFIMNLEISKIVLNI